jgi:hypothetical protein
VATLSGGSSPTGVMGFEVWTGAGCTGSVVSGSSSASVAGNGQYSSAPFSAPAPGTYYFEATYSGDTTNDGSTVCGGALTVLSATTSCSASVSSSFNSSPIPAGDQVWFNAHIKLQSPVPTTLLTITFTSTVTLTVPSGPNAGTITHTVPMGMITYDPSATTFTTTMSGGVWHTTVPANFRGDVFVAGLVFQVPTGGLPGGVQVKWSGSFTPGTGIGLQWQWSAAVYSQLGTGTPGSDAFYNSLKVNPAHTGSDMAGTPEGTNASGKPWKAFVVAGARGGGGSNWTGAWSGTGSCT